jgi:hypothetical protein
MAKYRPVAVASWAPVSSVGKGMNKYTIDTGNVSQPEQSMKVFGMAVYPAVGNQPHEVQRFVLGFAVVHRSQPTGVFGQRTVLCGQRNFDQILVDHSAGSQIGVAHLRITHLAFWQSNGQAARFQLGLGVVSDQAIHEGRVGQINRRYGLVFCDAPAVQNHQYRLAFHETKVRLFPNSDGAWAQFQSR